EYMRQSAVAARLVIPLEARGRRIGALVLAMCGSGRTFDRDDVALGMELAGRAALAIANARPYRGAVDARGRLERSEERLRRSLEALLGIHEVGKLLISVTDLDAVGRRVLEIAVRAARLDAAALRRREPGKHPRLWQQVGAFGGAQTIWRASAVKRGRARALASGQATAPGIRSGRAGGADMMAWCVPLVVKGDIVGVLEAIGEARPPDEPTEEILGSIALQASTALENARLYGEIASSERALHRL